MGDERSVRANTLGICGCRTNCSQKLTLEPSTVLIRPFKTDIRKEGPVSMRVVFESCLAQHGPGGTAIKPDIHRISAFSPRLGRRTTFFEKRWGNEIINWPIPPVCNAFIF